MLTKAASKLSASRSHLDYGDTVKMTESSLELRLLSVGGNTLHGQGNDLGYSEKVEDWIISSQVLKLTGNCQPWMQFRD